ncbi:MAG: protein-L-isoaspartate(D-aspartate) O-methyltransferase [Anaerolineales bacterium]|nr:protein-L-isoaspartate(D-aspartate) O-methyltransferase [Anaerolineales bacterium]
MKEEDYTRQRERMVATQIESRQLRNPRLLAAMRKIPRHKFIPTERWHVAYDDRPVMIGEMQTISQPYIVALMTNLLKLKGNERVLEIGTGSGYQAAILAEMCAHVYTVERHTALSEQAARTLKELGITNVTVRQADGSLGWPEQAPFDAIMVTAAAPAVPEPLLNQLEVGGRLVVPVGQPGMQTLQLWQRGESGFEQEMIVPVSFVPLRGEYGFKKDW